MKQVNFQEKDIEKMAKLNMLGIPFSIECGGAGQNELVFSMCIEEIAKHCASTAPYITVHNIPCWIIQSLEQIIKGKNIYIIL